MKIGKPSHSDQRIDERRPDRKSGRRRFGDCARCRHRGVGHARPPRIAAAHGLFFRPLRYRPDPPRPRRQCQRPHRRGQWCPLRLARRARHQHIASLLLERGAELPYDELPSANKATTPPPKVGTGNDEANAGGLPQLAITEPMASTGFSDLRQHPRPESNVIEFTSVPIPFSGAKPPETEAHGSSIEFSQESIPSVPTAAAAAVITTLPPPPAPETAADITVAPTSPEAFVDSPAQGYIEEIEMSTPYGVDTEILARDLSRLAAGTDIPPGGKSGR